jgi:cytochrome b involved in lipid metabolism
MRDNQISQKTIVTADSASSKSYVKKTLSDSYDHHQETVAPPRTYFKEDISLHCKPNDCWLVIKDKVLIFLISWISL